MKIINLTPHAITLVDPQTKEVIQTWPKGEIVPRLKTETKQIGMVNSRIPLTQTTFGQCEGLPEAKVGTLLIVSMLVRGAFPDRVDLISPNGLVRDEEGRIIGCSSFAVN